MKKQKTPEDQEIDQIKLAIKDLICGKNLHEVIKIILLDDNFYDEVSAQDMGREHIIKMLHSIMLKLDSRIIKKPAFLGLVLIYYGMSWKHLDNRTIYSGLCEAAYNDQLKSFLNCFFENNVAYRGMVLKRLNDFSAYGTSNNKTIEYWFTQAGKLLSHELKILKKPAAQDNPMADNIVEDCPIDMYDLYALVTDRLSVTSAQKERMDQTDSKRDDRRNLIRDNKIIVVTGKAGTGGTSWAKRLIAKLPSLNIDTCYYAVYIDATAWKEELLTGMDICETIFAMHFSDQMDLRKYIVAHLQQLTSTGELVVVVDNFSRLHSLNEDDQIIRRCPVLFDEQKTVLGALSGVSRIVMISNRWQVQPLTTALQGMYRKEYDNEAVPPIKLVDLDLAPECWEKSYEAQLSAKHLSLKQDQSNYYWYRYGFFCSDFRGIKATVNVLQNFYYDQHLRIFKAYLLDLSLARGFDYSEDIDIFQYSRSEMVVPWMLFETVKAVVRNIELGDFMDPPLYYVSANLCFPSRHRVKGPAFMQALNSELFDMHWINESLYIRITNDGLLAMLLSTFGTASLEKLQKSLYDKNIESAVMNTALNFSKPYSQDDFRHWSNMRRLSPPNISSKSTPCDVGL